MPATTTTTIRIEAELKQRIAAAADRSGKTAHAFILEAIGQLVEQAELDDEFQRLADARWSKLLANGKTVPWDDARTYLETRALEGSARRPAGRRSRR